MRRVKPWSRRLAARLALTVLALSACSPTAHQSASQADSPSLLSFEVGGKAKLRLEEVERTASTSTVRVTYDSTGSPTQDTFLLADALCKLAEARGARYFINLKEWSEPGGATMYVEGFADSDKVDIQAYFGQEYSIRSEYGQERLFMSVADWSAARRDGPLPAPRED